MAAPLDSVQSIQEDEYAFPYHYLADGGRGFVQVRHDAWGINYLATIDYLIERLRNERFQSVIDVGCGDGRFTRDLHCAFPNARVLGVDFSNRAVALAQAMVPEVEYRRADITKDLGERFDLAVLMEVYEHIPPEACPAFVNGLADRLNENGILYVTVPHTNKPVEPKHYRHFTISSLTAEFKDHFEILEAIPIEKRSFRKKLIDLVFTNPLFVLNNRTIGGLLYRFYRKRLFLVNDERQCQRIILRLRKK